jgi:hypothetical protein
MIRSIAVAAIAALGFSGTVLSQTCSCNGAALLSTDEINASLSGKKVCVGSAGNWEAQEEHQASGQLWDYKRGDGHPVDPRQQVGTWSTSGTGGNARITHSYTGGPSYSWNVCRVAGTSNSTATRVGFCASGNTPQLYGDVKAIGGGC